MAIDIKFDLVGNPEPPTIILANRNGNKLGQLKANKDSIEISDKFNDPSEFSFTINKYYDNRLVALWDKVVNFKLVYCKEWDMWFEITVELDEKNEAVKTVIQNNASYNNMVVITYNNEGDISLIQAKSYEINKVSQDVALQTEDIIERKGAKGVGIPLGTFLGISLLSGVGPNIDIKLKLIDSVYCSFISKFDSTGINQTLHRIYITIHASIGVVVPFYQKSFTAEQTILACENVIVGKVPEVYLYSDNMDTLLNFVPY